MAFTLPDWLQVSAADIRADSRFRTEMVSADFAEDSDLETAISRYVTEIAPVHLGRLRRSAGSVGFPSNAAKLAIAYPADDVEPDDDATDEEIEAAEAAAETAMALERAVMIAEQKHSFLEAVRGLVIAKMYKVQPSEDLERVARQHQDGRGVGSTGGARIGSPESIMQGLEETLRDIHFRYMCHSDAAFV